MRVTGEDIQRLAAEIGQRFGPQRVILFGSHARGTAGPDSDVDLLVIMEHQGSSRRKAYEMLRDLDEHLPVDLVIRTPQEFEYRVGLGDFFLREILREGKVLYERAH